MTGTARTDWSGVGQFVDLHLALMARDLKVRYRDTWLGLAWTLVTPLLFAGVLVFLFQNVLDVNMPRFSSFVLIGVLAYGWFRGAVAQGTRALTSSPELVRKPGFRADVLPAVAVSSSLLNFLLSLPIMAVVLAVGGTRPGLVLFWLPVIVAVQYVFTLGLAYLLAALNAVLRDTAHVVEIALTLGFFLTPIFYSSRAIPERFEWIYTFNPMVPLLEAYRAALIDARPPAMEGLAVLAVLGLVLSVVGYRVFRSAAARFADEL